MDVAAVAVPLDFRFRQIGDEMVLKGASIFEVGRTAEGALLGMDSVFDERGPWRWFVAHGTGVLAMRLAAAVGGCARLGRALGAGPLAALEDLLELVFHLREAAPQLGVFRPQFGVLRLQFQKSCPVVHDPPSFLKSPESGK